MNSTYSTITTTSNTTASTSSVSRKKRMQRRSHSTIRNQYLYKLGFTDSKTACKKNITTRTAATCPNFNHKSMSTPTTCGSSINGNKNKYHCPINDESAHTTDTYLDEESIRTIEDQEAPTPSPSSSSPVCISILPEDTDIQSSAACTANSSCANSFASTTRTMPASRTTTNKPTTKKRSVSFHETVTVLTIPSKDSYSDRIRKHLWIEPNERKQNTERNVIEFISENWDWRQVADDVEFYICPVTGEKIHPCHNIYSYHENVGSYGRPISRNPFFEKSRQAAMEWENRGRNIYSRQ